MELVPKIQYKDFEENWNNIKGKLSANVPEDDEGNSDIPGKLHD